MIRSGRSALDDPLCTIGSGRSALHDRLWTTFLSHDSTLTTTTLQSNIPQDAEVGAAGRSLSLDQFCRIHSFGRRASLRLKAQQQQNAAITATANAATLAKGNIHGTASNDSGETNVHNTRNVPVPTATADANATKTTGRQTRKRGGRAKAVSRDSSFADTLNLIEGPSDKAIKKERRMLSNRESARRSRRRKQELMLDLENKVARLAAENETLKKRIAQLEGRG
jgi:hypothetical protein